MGLKDEVAATVDPVEEEEEEQDLVDPQDTLRELCQQDSHCVRLQEELNACNDRVNGKTSTTENCNQELYDFVHCVDHCISKSLFSKLK